MSASIRWFVMIAVALSCSSLQNAEAFTTCSRTIASVVPAGGPLQSPAQHEVAPMFRSQSSTRIFQSSRSNDGSDRGIVIMGIVLAACIWVFSIPPYFRRAHFCVTEKCVANRSKCYDCVTTKEWVGGVKEYYQNGGGVQFDFTVAEETKQFWKDAVQK